MPSSNTRKDLALSLKEAFCEAKGEEIVLFRGRSMLPILREGDRLLVKHLSPTALSRGDIVVYKWGDQYLAHRLLCIRNKNQPSCEIVAKGDNSPTRDQPFGADSLVGKVVEIGRDGRTIRLDDRSWRRAARIFTLTSLTEAVIVESVKSVRRRLLGNLKINLPRSEDVQEWVLRGKVCALRILLWMART